MPMNKYAVLQYYSDIVTSAMLKKMLVRSYVMATYMFRFRFKIILLKSRSQHNKKAKNKLENGLSFIFDKWIIQFVFFKCTFRFQGDYWGDHHWRIGDADDGRAKFAYTAMLRIALQNPTGDLYDEFNRQVQQRSRDVYNYTYYEDEQVRTSGGRCCKAYLITLLMHYVY